MNRGHNVEKLLELSEIKAIKIFINTKWLLQNAMKDNLNASDIMIKILAIENYFNKNNFGMSWYNNMQRIRVSQNKKIDINKADNEKNFIKLIENIKSNGFDEQYPIELNKNFEVFEGSHRLACALYFNIERIPVTFNKYVWDLEYDYSINWFVKNGMLDYISEIKNKYKEYI